MQELSMPYVHHAPMNHAVFSPDGSKLASLSPKDIRLLDLDPMQEIPIDFKHKDSIQAMAFSPDGISLVSVGWAGQVRVFNTEMQVEEKLPSVEGHDYVKAIQFSPDGSKFFTLEIGGRRIVVWSKL